MEVPRSNDAAHHRQNARRRALLYRGFASSTAVHGRPRSFIRPHSHFLQEPHLAPTRAGPSPYTFVAAAPKEPAPGVGRYKASTFADPVAPPKTAGIAGMSGKAFSAGGKEYAPPPFKGLLSAFGPKALLITVAKCYALSFGNMTFGAEMEEQTITDEQVTAAHRASVELILRELATTTLRRCLEKLSIAFLDRRWSNKLLKDVGASARRKAFRNGRLFAAARIALTSLRSSLLVQLATWAVEALIDIHAMLRKRILPKTCARMILHRALNRIICALAGAAGASAVTLIAPGTGTFVGALLAESAAPYLTIALLGDVQAFAAA
mmetsp:Transcript_26945/g.79434  ORF Transcript_26945/g.79434 Transcript_26945/m.79434 type:complete len:323 (+) Transcript_26945:72-1040(+)